jgi:hypothetical protein
VFRAIGRQNGSYVPVADPNLALRFPEYGVYGKFEFARLFGRPETGLWAGSKVFRACSRLFGNVVSK